MQTLPVKDLVHSLNRGLGDVLHALGLERQRSFAERVVPVVSAFATGLAVGFAATALLSPRRGRDVVAALAEGFEGLRRTNAATEAKASPAPLS